MKILRIGDPHIRPANVAEADKLMEYAASVIVAAQVDRLEILGDLFHNHAVIRLEVLLFWNKWLAIFKSLVDTVVLVGNHDMAGDYAFEGHALTVFKGMEDERLKIVDAPYRSGVFGYTPYRHGAADWLAGVRQLASDGAKILVCHTTFDGSQYDNGFYAPGGINPDDVPFDTIISGHIHKEQIIAGGKVDYPGTPKWDTASDANERKGIWLYEHDPTTGRVLQRDCLSTAHVCTPIVSFSWIEGQEQPVMPEGAKISIELVGSSDWIAKQKASLKGKASIRSKTTDKKRKVERKVGNSLESYLLTTYNTTMDRQMLLDYAKEIGIAV